MMVFIDDPPGTVFKSAVSIVEMALYETVILDHASIDKIDMELVKTFVWVNCWYVGRLTLTILTIKNLEKQLKQVLLKKSLPIDVLIIKNLIQIRNDEHLIDGNVVLPGQSSSLTFVAGFYGPSRWFEALEFFNNLNIIKLQMYECY